MEPVDGASPASAAMFPPGIEPGVLLAARGLARTHGAVTALHPTSLDVWPGQIVAIVGPNGCGKSTLLRGLAGIASGEGVSGEVLHGAIVPAPAAAARVRSFVPQRPEMPGEFTAREVVRLGRFARGPDEGAVTRALLAVGLAARAELRVDRLSGGERQRVAVARAIAQIDGAQGGVLLLDEPFSGIDPAEVARIVQALRTRAETGAVVLSLHEPGLARAVATHAVVMRAGRVVAAGGAAETLTPVNLSSAYGHPIVASDDWLVPALPSAR